MRAPECDRHPGVGAARRISASPSRCTCTKGVDRRHGARAAGMTLVIADCGHKACLLVFDGEQALAVGDRFRWEGSLWEVVDARPHVKALVAQPVEH